MSLKKDIFDHKRSELFEIIKNSQLAEADKKEWERLIKSSANGFVAEIFELFSEYPEEIGWFNDIYKRKKGAFKLGEGNREKTRTLFEEIFKEEIEKLEQLSKK